MNRYLRFLPCCLAAAALVVAAGCNDSEDTGFNPTFGVIKIDIQPDDCPLRWTLTSGQDVVEGTGDRTLAAVVADQSYTLTVTHEPGWSADGPTSESFYLSANSFSEHQFVFRRLVLGEFATIPAGSFTMGSPLEQADSHEDERPQHQVTFTRPLLVEATEVTQFEYNAIMNSRPSSHHDCDDCPVEMISFRDAVGYCNGLSAWAGLPPVYTVTADTVICDWNAAGYRLPTESEWEYFCRAGTTTRFSFGDDPSALATYAWYGDNAGGQSHAVGLKPANAWGLHDCHGNVWEMTWDGYFWYPAEPVVDRHADPHNLLRMARGGDFHFGWTYATSSWRGTYEKYQRLPNLGLRVVRYADGGSGAVTGFGGGTPGALPPPGDKRIADLDGRP